MAKFENLPNQIKTLTEGWNEHSGMEVEDFITRKLETLDNKDIDRVSYDGSTQILSLFNSSGDEIASTSVSVATPVYSHTISIEGIYTGSSLNDLTLATGDTILCKLGTKVILKVRYNLTAQNPLSGIVNHVSGKQKLFVKIGTSGYVELLDGITSLDESQDIDITDLYTLTTVSTVSLRITTSAGVEPDIKTITATTKSVILVLDPSISYNGISYIVNGSAEFMISNGGGANYILQYSLNGSNYLRSDGTSIGITAPGINTLKVYAAISNNPNIKSDEITVNVINASGMEVTDNIVGVVNEISELFNNWEYSKLYKLSLFTKGYTGDEIAVNTILSNTADELDTYFDKTKRIDAYVVPDNGIYELDICYFFGMDLTSDATTSLIVSINGELIVKFEDQFLLTIKNDSSFTYTKGAEYSFDLFDPDNSTLVTKEVLSKMESPDGLISDDSLSVFRVSANDYSEPVLKLDLSSLLTNAGFTFELDFMSYNISDPTLEVLRLGRFVLYPTELNWNFAANTEGGVDKTARSSLFQEDARTHLLIEVVPAFKAAKREIPEEVAALANETISIVRVYINGTIDREFRYDTLDDFYDEGFNLTIAPKASDIDIYGMRVYKKALSLEEISNNYMSTMSDINAKKTFQKANDIVRVDSNGDTYISYALAKLLYNTLVYIMPKGTKYIHQFNATKETKHTGCTVFVNYVNNDLLPVLLTSEQIAKSSGRFMDVELKGLGTSAMKYYWYNTSIKGKFTSAGCYNDIEQAYIEPTEGLDLLYNSKKYYMPTDPNTGISKIVGKTNYASSMQSHKIGTTRAFHDLWNAVVDKSTYSGPEEYAGRKAVLEDPFLVFYVETDIEDLSNYLPSDLELVPDENVKFATFQTWGSAKGDKATSGYDEETTPGYLLLEGAENNGKLCNFLAPWMPDCVVLDGETWKTLGVAYDEQTGSAFYNLFDSWDVDFGLAEDSETELTPEAYETMDRFNEAYNFVYLHTINLLPYTASTSINDDKSVDTTKKYYITRSNYSDPSKFSAAQWDVLRYDQYSGMWVPAGLPKLDEAGHLVKHTTIANEMGDLVYDYEVFNLKTFCQSIDPTVKDGIDNFKAVLMADFKAKFGEYFHVDDILFHQAFIKLFAGTDNRAKNTYFKMLSKDHKILLLQDDMDTVLATDNRGLQKKPYFLIEPSAETEEYAGMWSGSSAFFELVDVAYRAEINNMLKSILSQFNINLEPSIHDWMLKYFYYVLEYFPATAYNHTARLAYESPQIFYEKQGSVGITWENNGQHPISLAHGSCLLSEKEFMKKRLVMFLSLAQVSNMFGREAMGINIKTSEDSGINEEYTVKITPYQYLYLGYNIGSNPILYSTDRLAENVEKEVSIKLGSDTPLYSVLGSRYIKKFDNFSKITWRGVYNLSAKRIIEMDASVEDGVAPKFLPSTITLETPVLTKLNVTNVSSISTLDLSSDRTPKLLEVYMTGTSIRSVVLPTGSRLKNVYFPSTIEKVEILNNPGLRDVQFPELNNLTTVNINCDKVGQFNVDNFCERLVSCNNLQSVTLRNANLRITEEALRKLIYCNTCILTGDIYIIDSIGSANLKAISFETKLLLVNTFGNISSSDSKIRIHFLTAPISTFNYASEVSVYYQAGEDKTKPITRTNLFGINVETGNDVEIVDDTNPFNNSVKGYLNITYSKLSGVSTEYADIDTKTGAITLKKETTSTATVVISMKVANVALPITKTVTVSFAWKAPQLGDFAYYDGTFTSSYDTTKTLVGLVYAKDETTAESGTVYIIGKEYSDADNSYYLGYDAGDGSLGAATGTVSEQLYLISTYLKSIGVNNHGIVSGIATHTPINNISVNTYTNDSNTLFSGASDTLKYIDHVNNSVLEKIRAKSAFEKYIAKNLVVVDGNTENKYSIKTIENLRKLCEEIGTIYDNTANTDYMSCILYPYFYSIYLYQPLVKEGESLHNAYTKGNWYAPSVAEFSRIVYYRGYSVSGNNFNTSDIIRQSIVSSVTNGKTTLTTPIFSMALDSAKNNFPTVWSNIVGSGENASPNNITTTATSEEENYSYQRVQSWDYNAQTYTYSNNWVVGALTDPSNWDNTPYQNAWRLTKHKGVPFTKFNYSKN